MSSTSQHRKKLLFVTYGGGHVNMLLPIIRSIRSDKIHDLQIIALTTASHELSIEKIPHRGFSSILKPDDHEAIYWGNQLAKEIQTNNLVSTNESIAYLGLSYSDLISRIGKPQAASEYKKYGRQAFLPLNPMRQIFDDENPDLLVTTISPRAEQAAIMVARERAIPSICLIDLFSKPSIERAQENGYGTKVCVLTEGVRQQLIDRGRNPSDIVVTGNPAFDSLVSTELVQRGKQLKLDRGWSAKKTILWASQVEPMVHPFNGKIGNPDLPNLIESTLVDFVKNNLGFRLVIRKHPNDCTPQKNHKSMDVEVSSNQDSLHELLHAVDLVVTMTSTVGVEARLIGKPVITVNLSVFSNDSDFSRAISSQGVNCLEEIPPAILNAFRSNTADNDRNLPNPGSATTRVMEEIERILG